jgi:hypothetical protein
MAANGDRVPSGRIVPAIPAIAGSQTKTKEEGQRELALFFGGDYPCRKDRFFLRSLCRRNSQRHRTRLISATRSCTSSNPIGRGQPLPRASITAYRCVFAILLTETRRASMKRGLRRTPTAYSFCATRSLGLAGATQSSHSAMLSARSSKRFGSATM